MNDVFILDASAVLAWRDSEPGSEDVVEPILEGAWLSSVNCGEVRYKAAESGDDPDALVDDLTALGLQIIDFTDDHARHLPALRAIDRRARDEHRRRGRKTGTLSLADLCCLALALEAGGQVVTGDRHWATLASHGLSMPVLNYKDAARAK